MGRQKRSAETTHSSEGPSEAEASMQEQSGPGDLPPTQSTLFLLPFNGTGPSNEEDARSVVRIVGGQDCKDGECPWQVTEERAGVAQAVDTPRCPGVGGAEMTSGPCPSPPPIRPHLHAREAQTERRGSPATATGWAAGSGRQGRALPGAAMPWACSSDHQQKESLPLPPL